MHNIILPEDLKNIGRKKIKACVISFGILLLVSIFVIILAKNWLDSVTIQNKVYSCIFLLALPFALSGFPHKLMDKTWSGRIVRSDIKTVVARRHQLSGYLHRVNITVVDVVRDGDDLDTEIITNVKIKADGHLDMYHKGNRVVHVYGCEHLYVMPLEPRDPVVCVVCGMKNFSEENEGTRGFCKWCGHSLDIKIKEI